ncbi:ylmG homolog protein 1-2, chloroplastic-like [Macadamia integrifolia]|uniref:ylmG homolog protein 1-2, chloroplastic-like n=1 Tax=Macadamia integrifolia TaxID=60698 RepID=UPI001C52B74C|nr:ylmG homolog protein 1-2, chloroplastic-like [Macadamia integrifolia]
MASLILGGRMASLMASGALLPNPNPNPSLPSLHKRTNRPSGVSLSHIPSLKPLNLTLHRVQPYKLCSSSSKLRVFASSIAPSTPTEQSTESNPNSNLISDSTRTVATVVAVAFSVWKLFADMIRGISFKIKRICMSPTPEEMATMQNLQENLVCTVGPLFFAALRDRPSGYLNTPLTVVAAGMAKWLDIYSGVLMVRVLLSWFPNIPWDRQPLSAIRDLCDPYLNLFRNIIPPVFDTLDVSPLLAFAVLGTLGSILNNSRGSY